MYDDIKDILKIKDSNKRNEALKQLSPHIVVEVFINEDNEIEDYKLIAQYCGGEFGDELSSWCDYYDSYSLERYGLFEERIVNETNALYHVSIYFHWYECGGLYYNEYDMDGYITNVVKIKTNYRNYLNKQEEYCEQKELSFNDSEIESIDYCGSKYSGRSFQPHITYSDLKKYAKIIAKEDIRLAHRIYLGDSDSTLMKDILGKYYDENLHKIESRRIEFKQYIKRNKNIRYDTEGYFIDSLYYKGLFIRDALITFDVIDNLSDEILLKSIKKDNFKEILEEIKNDVIVAKAVMDKLTIEDE